MPRARQWVAIAFLGVVAGVPCVHARNLGSVLAGLVRVDGTLRYYVFHKAYEAPLRPNQYSGAAGGLLRLRTRPVLGGFGLGVGLYGAWSTRAGPADSPTAEKTLLGPRPVLTSIGEAYVQFARDGLLVRGGRQVLQTPWMGARDSRMAPQTYEALWGQYTLLKGLQLLAARVHAFKSRDSHRFSHDNLYYPGTYEGDTLEGTTRVFAPGTRLPEARGTLAAAVRYHAHRVHGSLWYYDFRGFARAEYVQAGYRFGMRTAAWRPYIAAQLMRQVGGSTLVRYGARLFGQGGVVDAIAWGVLAGVRFGATHVALSYNNLGHRTGAFGGGAIVSPYGANAALYTSVMTANLLKYGPGSALKLAFAHVFHRPHITLQVAAVMFHTAYNGRSATLYADGVYAFAGRLSGLQVRNRLAWDNGAALNGGHALLYDRLMLQYRFSN